MTRLLAVGTLETWLFVGGIVVVAVVLVVIVDSVRGPMKCDGCGDALTGVTMRRKVKGKWRTLCKKCESRGIS